MNIRDLLDFTEEINCIDRSGNTNIFLYNLQKENHSHKWIFKVIPQIGDVTDFFEFIVEEIDSKTVKVTQMRSNIGIYSAKGIPEKLIEEASKVLDCEIISSSNNSEFKHFQNEWRTEAATKVWKRLVDNQKALYMEDGDYYIYL